MANLYEILADAQNGDAMAEFGRTYGLTPQQTQTAVAALLPAISLGLKQSTATPEGLGQLFSVMGRQPDLYAMYDDPSTAFSPEGREAGNAVLSTMFGSPDASRAIAGQAQQLSGVTSSILKKLLPVLAGILISGLMRSGSGQATPSAPKAPAPAPEQGGGVLGDILREIFGQGSSSGPASGSGGSGGRFPSPVPPIGDILGPERDGSTLPTSKRVPIPSPQPLPVPTDAGGEPAPTDASGQSVPGGDLLSQILRELEKGIKEGRVKPVIVGPFEIGIPGQAGSADSGSGQPQPQPQGGDILGQILREMLGGGGKAQVPGQSQGLGAAIFGDSLEPGRDVDPDELDSLQQVFERFLGAPRR